jgi:hypothetical protein
MEGDRKLKQWMRCMVLLILIMSVSTVTFGEEAANRGTVTGLVGNASTAWYNYHYTDKIDLTGSYVNESDNDNDYELIRAGIDYDLSDRYGVKAGILYDLDEESVNGYGGFDFSVPFGSNLHLNGFYDYNYKGEKWGRYEAVVQIEMYPGHYLNAGVMGNTGSGAEIYDYNEDNEAMLFMRGDFNWKVKKFGIELKPVVMVKGEFFHDYNVTYDYNERTKIVLNMNSLWDKEFKYRIGLEYKF